MGDLDFIDFDDIVDEYEPIKAGWYECSITGVEWRASKNNSSNEYLRVSVQIEEGKYKGRKASAFLNLKNESEQAVSIAKVELKRIKDACGIDKLQSTDQLLAKRVSCELVMNGDFPKPAKWRMAQAVAEETAPSVDVSASAAELMNTPF